MQFDQILQQGRLIRRYKRFLADVELDGGKRITVHCPNSGSMLGCDLPGSEVRISRSENPKRKYPHTLEMVRVAGGWVGINTSRTNSLVREALEKGIVSDFGRIETIRPEVKVSDGSRLDFLLTTDTGPVYLEVKNCTLAEDGVAMFPDAVTTRGTKHLHELLALHEAGFGAAVLFCVQRIDNRIFAPAAHIDPVYAETLADVSVKGIMVVAYQADVSPEEINVCRKLPVRI